MVVRLTVSRLATAVALLLVAVPLAAGAQPIARIGLLGDYSWEPLRQGLRDLGYVEGKNVILEDRPAGGRNERWPGLAAELVRLNVQVIGPRVRRRLSPPSGPPRRSPSSWPSPAIP
jgi:hypothetical protein